MKIGFFYQVYEYTTGKYYMEKKRDPLDRSIPPTIIIENESLFMRFTKKEFCKVYKAFFAFSRKKIKLIHMWFLK